MAKNKNWFWIQGLLGLTVLACACNQPTGVGNGDTLASGGTFFSDTNVAWQHTFEGSTVDRGVWTPEITMGGGGNNEYQFYNDSPQNLYVKNGALFIKPGLTKDYQLQPGQSIGQLPSGSPLKIATDASPGFGEKAASMRQSGSGTLSEEVVLGCGLLRPEFANTATCPGYSNGSWWIDLGTQCTQQGNVYDLGQNAACVRSSGAFASKTNPVCNDKSGPCPAHWSILNPVTSARITNKNSGDLPSNIDVDPGMPNGFRYGRLEVRAKIPKGDWLWPSIWMLAVDDPRHSADSNGNPLPFYGQWPACGEIDIFESRGNSRECSQAYMDARSDVTAFGGVQSIASTLHWGPRFDRNGFLRTHTEYSVPTAASTLDAGFHIYGIRWNETGLYTYIDDDANHILEVSFANQSFWSRATAGDYSHCLKNGSPDANTFDCTAPGQIVPSAYADWTQSADPSSNPWRNRPNAAPFDQPFYLIINLAIGGTAGEGTTPYFPDGWCGKPWSNTGIYPVADFYASKFKNLQNPIDPTYAGWWSTWLDGTGQVGDNAALQVDEIRYWKEASAGIFSPLSSSAGQ